MHNETESSQSDHRLVYKKRFDAINAELTFTFHKPSLIKRCLAGHAEVSPQSYSWDREITQAEAASIWEEYWRFKRIIMTDIAKTCQLRLIDAVCSPENNLTVTLYENDNEPIVAGTFPASLADELLPPFLDGPNVLSQYIPRR